LQVLLFWVDTANAVLCSALPVDDDSGEVLLMPMKAGVDAVDDDSDAEVNTEAENDPAAERADSDETDLGSPAVMTRSPDIPSAFDLM